MMTDSIKADILYFKTLTYEEIFRLFNNFKNMKVFLVEEVEDFVFYLKTIDTWRIILNKNTTREHRKYKMIYLYGLVLSGLAMKEEEREREPFKSKIDEYNAEFDALYNK